MKKRRTRRCVAPAPEACRWLQSSRTMTVLLIAEPPAAAEDWAYPVHQIAS